MKRIRRLINPFNLFVLVFLSILAYAVHYHHGGWSGLGAEFSEAWQHRHFVKVEESSEVSEDAIVTETTYVPATFIDGSKHITVFRLPATKFVVRDADVYNKMLGSRTARVTYRTIYRVVYRDDNKSEVVQKTVKGYEFVSAVTE